MPGRLLFVCAQGSGRAVLAASLLQHVAADRWEAWSVPPDDQHQLALVDQVLREQGRSTLSANRLVYPISGMTWDDMIILCSGTTDT